MMGNKLRRSAVTRGLFLLCALVAAPAQVRGQSATATAQHNDLVTFAELDGRVIEASTVRDQIVRRDGKTFFVRFQNDIKLVIGPDARIQMSSTPTSDSPRGRRVGRTLTGPFLLEKSKSLYALGGGEGIFLFKDGVLTFIRTFKAGAIRRTIAFTRTPDGLSCAVEENFAREKGAGDVAMNSAIDDQPATIISSKTISSACRVVKQSETPTASDAPVGAVPNNK